MAVRTIRRVNTDLPVAGIYLDDLKEIELLLAEAYAKISGGVALTVEYEVDSRLAFTSVDELLEHSGSSTDFRMTIRSKPEDGWRYSFSDLTIYRTSSPKLNLDYLLQDYQYEIFGKVEQIFVARSNWLKRIVRGDAVNVLFGVGGGLLLLQLSILVILSRTTHLSFASRAWAFVSVPIMVLIAMLVVWKLRASRIYLTYARKDERAREALLKERFEKLIWLIAGALFGIFGTMLAGHYKH